MNDSAMIETRPGRMNSAPATSPPFVRCRQPADIGRELLRLRAGQEHAVVERVQKPGLADPALLLDQDAVHHGDLPGRPAKGQKRDARPHPHGLAERDSVRLRGAGVGGAHGRAAHADALTEARAGWAAGQLWVSAVASRHQR
jgi:hypothetical protein